MIGIIITGHGGFAKGMEENVKMLAGNDIDIIAVPFTEEMSPEAFDENMAEAMAKYADRPTFILADFTGGTPYNRAATLSVEKQNVRVLGGANSAMLIDAAMRGITGEEITDLDKVAEELMASAHENISLFKLEQPADDGMEEDGI